MEHHLQRIILDGSCHLIEHIVSDHLVLDKRILLSICCKPDRLPQLIHIIDVVHPVCIHRLQQDDTLDLTNISASLCQLLLLRLIKVIRFLNQLFLQLTHGLSLYCFLRNRQKRNDRADQIIELLQIRLVLAGALLITHNAIHTLIDTILDHFHNRSLHVVAIQDLATLCVDDLPLLIIDLVILQQVLSDRKVIRLDLFLCLFNGIGQHLMLNLLTLMNAKCPECAHHLIRAKQPHQVILQGNVELGLTRVTLSAGTATQLVIDPSGLMPLRPDYKKAAGILRLLIQFDIGTTACHIGCNGDRIMNTGILDDGCLLFMELRIQHVMRDPLPAQHV